MEYLLHKAGTRGHANHGWLDSHHTFSFAGYYNPERINFGALRVLNDDVVAQGAGFGVHPHDNMEIISIPLAGALEHKDSMDNVHVLRKNDVQVMSAGTGIMHSEYNHSREEEVRFLQIWVVPNQTGVTPRYDQQTFDPLERKNQWQAVVTPNPEDGPTWIHQQAWFHLGNLEKGASLDYQIRGKGNGVYIFVIEGETVVENVQLKRRDGLGIWDADRFTVKATETAEVLLMEVPM